MNDLQYVPCGHGESMPETLECMGRLSMRLWNGNGQPEWGVILLYCQTSNLIGLSMPTADGLNVTVLDPDVAAGLHAQLGGLLDRAAIEGLQRMLDRARDDD
jgi:hypothetical protein